MKKIVAATLILAIATLGLVIFISIRVSELRSDLRHIQRGEPELTEAGKEVHAELLETIRQVKEDAKKETP